MPGPTSDAATTVNNSFAPEPAGDPRAEQPAMPIKIHTRLFYTFPSPTDVLLQVEAANMPDQTVGTPELWLTPTEHFARVEGHDEIGQRIWLRSGEELALDYYATVDVRRPNLDIAKLPETLPHLLPGETVDYLMPSRFCPSDRFAEFTASEFAGLCGGPCVAAIRDWVAQNMTYVPGVSNAQTCATDTFVQRQGVCRDYAHLVVALCRAVAVPARLCAVYAPDVTPPDFHAVAEVFLAGQWHLIDATGMASADSIVVIGVGRDAADVPFLSSFGAATMIEQKVEVERVS